MYFTKERKKNMSLKILEKNQKNRLGENTSGISLISLVVAIIVLLILAGVSMAMLTSQNRNITPFKTSKKGNRKSN